MKWPCVRYVATLCDELRVKESAVINLLSTCIFRSMFHEYSFSLIKKFVEKSVIFFQREAEKRDASLLLPHSPQ